MSKQDKLKVLENYSRRLFKNISKNGDWINFSCPLAQYSAEHKYREDKSPSAGAIIARDGKAIWRCFTCKGAGHFTTLLRYLEKHKQVSYEEIIQSINEQEELPSYENRFYCEEIEPIHPLEYPNIFDEIADYPAPSKYLADRGISPVTVNKLGLKYDSDSYRIVFPVCDKQGRIYGYTGRTILPKEEWVYGYGKIKDYYFPKSQFLLGVEHWNKDLPVIVVEGLFAFAHLHELSKGKTFPFNICAIMGSSASPKQIETLLLHCKPVYCLLDNDDAGRVGMFGRRPMPDWKPYKIQAELEKGLTYQLKDHIPTYVMNWPKEDIQGQLIAKEDPDQLTYDEICAMVARPKLVV